MKLGETLKAFHYKRFLAEARLPTYTLKYLLSAFDSE